MLTAKQIAFGAVAGWVGIDVYIAVADWLQQIPPIVLFQWDASNIVGKSAFSGGLPTALFGLVMDLVVSAVWAAICVVIVNRVTIARRNPIPFGILYGAFVMFMMLWVIVPLGHASQSRMSLSHFAIVLAGHTLFFGLPMALAISAARAAPSP